MARDKSFKDRIASKKNSTVEERISFLEDLVTEIGDEHPVMILETIVNNADYMLQRGVYLTAAKFSKSSR